MDLIFSRDLLQLIWREVLCPLMTSPTTTDGFTPEINASKKIKIADQLVY
jgi:hypothetical protein